MFLLDTSILSDAQNPQPLVRVQRWLRRQARIAIPFPVILEIEQGILDVRRTKPHKADELGTWLREVLVSEFEYPEITPEVARTLADMNCCGPLKNFWYVNPHGKKEKRPSQDLFIAAISIVHDLPLATMNEKDFVFIDRYFPLPGVYNPNTGCWAVRPDHLADIDAVEAELVALETILESAQQKGRMLPLPFEFAHMRLAFA
ncbi:type II toxin-antitoxin system VapC family toxin [Rhizobium deserti]|uniref:Type II toxin-antitoxin system VapC family toxin n=1 Tax=Rhizobium deserti TaxID=2547961 RepID=A0A4R5UAK2_9HYPH|nr:PIN domain-containing protein [Rhizobium deserti]TDK31828.1 type II toxin-antitoxin system VapC family toxin [Rhizobium deserti]